jgi:MFS family permease
MTTEKKKSFWALIVTQFFGAFNDNVLKVLVQLLVVKWIVDAGVRSQLVVLATVVFDAPFILFSMMAGRLADRVGKPKVIRGVQVWQFVVVTVAAGSVYAKSIPAMMLSIFLLSMQAAFFSPAKYGILPELMPESELPQGNGLLNMATFVAILVGTIVGSFLAGRPMIACALLMAGAVGGLVASLLITPLPAARAEEPWAWNPVTDLIANWRIIREDRPLKLGIIAANYFWFMSSILVTVIFLYAKDMMHVGEKTSGLLLIAVTVGIAIGSVLAGKLSRGKIDLRLVRLGALGMSLFAIDLFWAWSSLHRTLIDFFMLGLSAGFYEIPLAALIQGRSPAGERGRVLATQNFLSFVAIFFGAAALWVLQTPLHLDPAQVFLTLGILSLIGTSLVHVLAR